MGAHSVGGEGFQEVGYGVMFQDDGVVAGREVLGVASAEGFADGFGCQGFGVDGVNARAAVFGPAGGIIPAGGDEQAGEGAGVPGVGAAGTDDGQFGEAGAAEAGGVQAGGGGLAADGAGQGGAAVGIAGGGGFVAGIHERGRRRFGDAGEVRILRHQAGVFGGLAHGIGEGVGGEVVGGGAALALADGDADVRGGIPVRHILVDAVVGETGQRLLGGGEVDVGIGGRRAVAEGILQQGSDLGLAEHSGTGCGLRRCAGGGFTSRPRF